jgi:hypothetical protein
MASMKFYKNLDFKFYKNHYLSIAYATMDRLGKGFGATAARFF